jgi:(1->4)-alpha-D-glucan 1-alpha-D-glucosylmutase
MPQEAATRRRIPRATYRLQLGEHCTLQDARALVPYLARLGISDLYLSPVLRAARGSTHGYDVVDHGQIDPRLGTYADLEALGAELRAHGMGLILDVVPNHMGIGDPANAWWMDVMEFGQCSPYARYFDIDWRRDIPGLEHRVLIPVLEDQYGAVLEAGLLRVERDKGGFVVRYWDRVFPVTPRSYAQLLEPVLASFQGADEADAVIARELAPVLTALRALPRHDEAEPERRAAAREWARDLKLRVAVLFEEHERLRLACDQALSELNGERGVPQSFDALDRLLDEQVYRLAYWRVAGEEINYRRFFDINDLAAIRVELPQVFEDTHRLIFRAVEDGVATGLRIDHPDGLLEPFAYVRAVRGRARSSERNDAETPARTYLVVEKILSEGETLDTAWAADGTTGYDFLAQLNGIFVNRRARRAFDRLYAVFTGREVAFRDLANATKKLIMLIAFAGEIQALARRLDDIASRNRRYRDFTLNTLTFALREIIAALPVYRTYIGADGGVSNRDIAAIASAVAEAKRRNPRTAGSVFDFVGDTLMLTNLDTFAADDRPLVREFALRVQQTTGPVMAKGVEDTAFYIANRLVSLNEVGGNPAQFGISVEAFHRANAARARRWPHTMTTTATHDTKRGEDVRARLNVLSEVPSEWRAAVHRWTAMNERLKTPGDTGPMPTRNDEYLFYQTVVGAWPGCADLASFRERVVAYMAKAAREAKEQTSWIEPNEAYESALERFVRGSLAEDAPFVSDVPAFVATIERAGYLNGLSQTLIKLTAPGVPDTYQGCELWDFSLVDPDNRRPVDFTRRAQLLAQIEHTSPRDLLERAEDGRIKMFVLHRALRLRAEQPDLFERGQYVALQVTGRGAERVVAFARRYAGVWAVTMAPRFCAALCADGRWPRPVDWADLRVLLPARAPSAWRDVLTGADVRAHEHGGGTAILVPDAFATLPFALLLAAHSRTP